MLPEPGSQRVLDDDPDAEPSRFEDDGDDKAEKLLSLPGLLGAARDMAGRDGVESARDAEPQHPHKAGPHPTENRSLRPSRAEVEGGAVVDLEGRSDS